MIFGTYRDLFTAIAGCAAALTGLLFVAISVAPRRHPASPPDVTRQFRAAASLLAFTNVLAVSLFGLVPGNNIGYPATAVAVVGIMFNAAGIRSILAGSSARSLRQRGLGLIVFLLLTFGLELASGIALILNAASSAAIEVLSNVVVACLLIGVARAWELVGDRDTGILSSIAVLVGHSRGPGDPFGIAPGGSVEPDTAEPCPADPGPADPGAADPGAADPGTADPGPAESGPDQPGTAGQVASHEPGTH